ncbi:MAG: ABC transporter substrate-binding protein [Bacillota bacterium]|nr:ABC transporter substrate-binding protein [Bacillota bacterium]
MKLKQICIPLMISLGLCACSKEKPKDPNQPILVGIVQIADNKDLTYATNGFEEALKKEFGDEEILFDVRFANGEAKSCSEIINSFIQSDVSMIMTNGSTPLKIAKSKTDTIPIVATSVNDYASTLGVSNWTGSTGTNVTGTSDRLLSLYQADSIRELFPVEKYKKVGFLMNEETDTIKEIKTYLKEYGYQCESRSYKNVKELVSFSDTCDVLYLAKDKMNTSNIKDIESILTNLNIPVYTNDKSFCRKCGVATLSLNYYALGYKTGQMAYQILKGEADIESMEIQYATNFQKLINVERANQLGIVIPKKYAVLEEN